MCHHAVLRLLCALGVFQTGLTALIETQQTVMAAAGDEASLHCQLLQPKDVLQVTWQRISPEGERNVATYNELFGEKVNAGFQEKVAFEAAGLQSCSIVIRNVSDQDRGCYRCLFNTYPEGALIATTCLQLYELHEADLLSPADGFDEESGSDNSDHSVMVISVSVVVVLFVCVAAPIIIILLVQKHWNRLSHRDPEESRTPQKPIQDTRRDNTQTPLMKQENELRLRGSSGRKIKCDHPKASPQKGRRLNFDHS